MRFDRRAVLVTGAAKGIGLRIGRARPAEAFMAELDTAIEKIEEGPRQ